MPLTALDPTWINSPGGVGPSYDSEDLRRNFGFLLGGGATAGVSRTGVLDVRALTVTLSGNDAQVNPGGCAIATAKGAYLTGATATATIDTLTPADATNPRRDRVVLEVLDPDNGGGAGRIAQFRVIPGTPSATAASGGGFPPAPTNPSITLAQIDVPKSGNGNPVVTDIRPFTAASGGTLPVRNTTDLATVTKTLGRKIQRQDLPGVPTFTWDGARWAAPPLGFLGAVTNNGATATGTAQSALVTQTLPLEPNRRIKIRAKVTAKPDTAELYGEYKIYAGALELETFVKRFSAVELGESLEFTADHGSGVGGSVEFHLQCRVVAPAGTTGRIKSDAFSIKLTVFDDGTA